MRAILPTLHAAGRAELPLLCALMAPRDVWDNLGYARAPTPFLLALSMRQGMQALIIRMGPEPVGLFLVYGAFGAHRVLEFDGAISRVDLRRRGLARHAMELFLRFMAAGRCRRLEAVIHLENSPSQALLAGQGFSAGPQCELPGRHGGPPRRAVLAWMEWPHPTVPQPEPPCSKP